MLTLAIMEKATTKRSAKLLASGSAHSHAAPCDVMKNYSVLLQVIGSGYAAAMAI